MQDCSIPILPGCSMAALPQNGDLYLAMEYVDGVPIHRYCESRASLCSKAHRAFHSCLRGCPVRPPELRRSSRFEAGQHPGGRRRHSSVARLWNRQVACSISRKNRQAISLAKDFNRLLRSTPARSRCLATPSRPPPTRTPLVFCFTFCSPERLPYEFKELTTAEMLRVICEQPPRKPDHVEDSGQPPRLGPGSDLVEGSAQGAGRSGISPPSSWLPTSKHILTGGLWRHAAEPFATEPPSLSGAIALRMAAAALVAVILAAGIVGVLWQARVANEERRRAEARSSDLRQLSSSLLSELDEAIKQLPGSTPVQKLLVTRVLEHLDRMATDAHGDRHTHSLI